jgi:amidohydrolase
MDKAVLQQILEGHFRWFHRHPEPSNMEKETTAQIKRILNEAGVELMETGLKTGLAARIRGKSPEPVIALRCDIDALPITECSGLEYASLNPGFMHACGHDFHICAMLGAALLLKEEADNLEGTVTLLFQPAEEGQGGAQQVLDTGVLDSAKEIYGIHVMADLETGVLGISAGATFAAVGVFKILIKGKGAHGAAPHEARDPVIAAAQLVGAAQTIISRNTSPFDQAVLSFTHIEAGNTWNVIPETALLEGTFRAFGDEKLAAIALRLEEICRGIGVSCAVDVDLSFYTYTPAVNNDPALTGLAIETAKNIDLVTVPSLQIMGGEDFALYQKTIPGVFWTIGVGSPHGLHHPGFIANLSPLSTAAEYFAALTRDSLRRLHLTEEKTILH